MKKHCFYVFLLTLFLSAFPISLFSSDSISTDVLGNFGVLDEENITGSDLWVVHIKDAHCNPEAQLNSIRIIKNLIQKHNFYLVCMEGSSSVLSVNDLTSFPDDKAKNDVLLNFLENGQINGVEYLLIQSPENLVVEGIEDKKLYVANYYSFYKSLSFRKKALFLLDSIHKYLVSLKPIYFSDELLYIDEQYNDYIDGVMTVFDFFQVINLYADKHIIPLKFYEDLCVLSDASKLKDSIDFSKVESEKDSILKLCLKYASEKDRRSILETNMKYKFNSISTDDFYNAIIKLCDDYLIDIEDFENFSKCREYSKILRRINHNNLLTELTDVYKDIKTALYDSENSRNLDNLIEISQTFKEACRLSLPPNEANRLSKLLKGFNEKDVSMLINDAANNHNITSPLEETTVSFITYILSYVCDFYLQASQRNNALVENSIRAMKKNNTNRCVLYTGGFHTEGIRDLLNEKNISYSIISPNIGHSSDDEIYYYLLSNKKDKFIQSLETNLRKSKENQTDTLALESKLVPAAEVMLDPLGAESFRNQLKTFYTSAGIRNALDPIKSTILPLVETLDQTRLNELSDRIQKISQWKLNNFTSLEKFALIRNADDGVDLQLTIDGQNFYVRNIIISEPQTTPLSNFQETNMLTTINVGGVPISIYTSQTSGSEESFILNNVESADITDIILLFDETDSVALNDALEALPQPTDKTQALINLLIANNMLIKQGDSLILNPGRKNTLLSASKLFRDITKWISLNVDDLSKYQVPEEFINFLNDKNILKLELPDTVTFPAVLFLIENLYKNFDKTAVFPYTEDEVFVIKTEKIFGEDGYRLYMDKQDANSAQSILKERQILMGYNYSDIIKQQLFGTMPVEKTEIIADNVSESSVVVFDNPAQSETSRVVWSDPSITSVFWREVNQSTFNYSKENFVVTGGLLFGTLVDGRYIVTDIVPLRDGDYSFQSDEIFTLNPDKTREYLRTYARDGKKLIGVYRNHSPERLAKYAQPGVDRRDALEGFPFDLQDERVIENPLGIVFEPSLSNKTLDKLRADDISSVRLIDPSTSSVYFYTQPNEEPVIMHTTSAYEIITPGEQLFETTERDLYLRRLNESQAVEENTLVTFRRLPENRGFVLLAGNSVSQEDIRFFIQFFKSIRKDIETFSDVREIQIKSGMRKSAHINRDDSILEFSTELLPYHSLIQYLALPHEWNHFLINIKDKELEEIIAVMYDYLRLNQLMHKDKRAADKFLAELEDYEEPYNGKQLFLESLKKMKAKVEEVNRFLSPNEFYDFAMEYIQSEPDLRELTKNIRAREDKEYFVNKFTATMQRTQVDVPPLMPGEQDYFLFDDATLGEAYTLTTSIIDFAQLRPKYLSGSNFFEHASGLAKSPDLNFQDVTGFFSPSTKELGVNISNPYHLNEDGSVNPDMVLSTIIRQQTHYLLHHNPGVLDRLVEQINSDEKVRDAILMYFIVMKRSQIPGLATEEEEPPPDAEFREKKDDEKKKEPLIQIHKGKIIAKITKEHLEQIAKDPTFATDGKINYHKIVNEVISATNGFNTVIHSLAKYSDIKKKLESDNQPVPESLSKKIAQLQKALFRPENIILFKFSENAEKYLKDQDSRLNDIFRIPYFSVMHILFDDSTNVLETPANDIQQTLETLKTDGTAGQIDDIAVKKQETKPFLTELLPDALSAEEFNNFLTTLKTLKQLPPAVPIHYNKETSYLNANEFFEYLLTRKESMPMASLPEEITITDIYLGNSSYIKDFLDKFKELDVNDLFYSRLRYNVISHSPASNILLNQLKESGDLDSHKAIVSFHPFKNLKEAGSLINNSILVRSFGDMALLSNVVLIEKQGDSFFMITGKPKAADRILEQFSKDKLVGLIQNPHSIDQAQISGLTADILDNLAWEETKIRISVEDFPFGAFLKSYTQNTVSGRFVFHPDLLNAAHHSLSNMAMSFGGYWQINGNSFGAISEQLIIPEKAITELDSVFLSAILGDQGGFIFESHESYFNRKTDNSTILPVVDELRRMEVPTLAQVFLPVTFSDINNSARIFNILQDPTYKSNDPFTFQRFIRDLKRNGLIPATLTADLKTDPLGVNNFLFSLTESFKSQLNTVKIANAIIETAKSTESVSLEKFITELMANQDIQDSRLSYDYLKKIYDNIAQITKNKKDFHLKTDVLPPEHTVSVYSAKKSPTQPVADNVTVKVRKLKQQQFNSYIQQIKRDHPHLDFNDPRGLANPMVPEIVINADHPDHKTEDGTLNLAGFRQTLIHEKTHMLTFKHWDILADVAADLKGRTYEQDQIIQMFYEFYFEEKIDSVTKDHRERLRIDPLWSINGEISYERLISELLSVINQYRMLPTLMKKFSSSEKKLLMNGKSVPPVIIQSQKQINEVFSKKRELIASTVTARQKLNLIDQRITSTFLFDAKVLNMPIVMREFDMASIPLPSTPIQTVFSEDELNAAINQLWLDLGIGDINRGKTRTELSGLQLSEFKSALENLSNRDDITGADLTVINKALDFWEKAVEAGKVHLYPTHPGSYTIQGSHFLHITQDGDIIIAKGFFDHLRETRQIEQAISLWGAKFNDLDTDNIEKRFEGKPIAQLQKELFEEYLENKDYLPVLNDILALYGIKIDEISNRSLKKIIEQHKDTLDLPGIQDHLGRIKKIISEKALLNFEESPVAEAFKIYAETSISTDEISKLRESVYDISAIVTRETSAPVIFLIDYKAVSGPVSPQNFALRETIERIRHEIEILERKNVVLIAVNIGDNPVGEIRKTLDQNLLRKGAASDDFDYIVSYETPDSLLTALQQEFKDISPQTLKANLKILTAEGNPLIALAKDHELALQTINESDVHTNMADGQGVFLIDYLRTLGIPNFISADSSEIAVDMRNSMYINEISELIDTSNINEKIKPYIYKFAELTVNSPDKSLDDLFNLFFERETALAPEDWQYLIPLLEEQFILSRSRLLLSATQSNYQGNIAQALAIFEKLKSIFESYPEDNKPTYSKLLNEFFQAIRGEEQNYINSRSIIESELSKSGIIDSVAELKPLGNLYIQSFLKRDKLTDSEFFVVNSAIKSAGTNKPVAFNDFSELLTRNGIAMSPELSRYFHVEIAPKPIKQDISNLMATQKLFDEAA